MKANYQRAFDALKAMGCPVIEGGYNGEDSFRISGEDNCTDNWADFYKEFGGPGLDDFGVNHKINNVLDRCGLYAEWINPRLFRRL